MVSVRVGLHVLGTRRRQGIRYCSPTITRSRVQSLSDSFFDSFHKLFAQFIEKREQSLLGVVKEYSAAPILANNETHNEGVLPN